MNKLERELLTAAKKPKMSAKKFSQQHTLELTKNYGVTRQRLRDVAVLIDKQVAIGHSFKVKAAKAATKEKKIKLAEAPIPKEVKKADAKPPKAKVKPKVKAKPKAKTKAKTKSKKKK